MEERKEISLMDNFQELVMKMSEGNPGGFNVMMQMAKESQQDAFMQVLSLDDMNIRGSQIWIAYKNFCNSDIKTLIECIKNRDKNMIDKINEESKKSGISWIAVEGGASASGNRKSVA